MFRSSTQVLLLVLVCLGVEISLLDLNHLDLSVPFLLESDTNVQLMYIKSLLDNGWTYNIPALSAPFGLSGAGFPVATNSDWAVMKALSAFRAQPGWILNVYWLLSMVLSGFSASYASRALGASHFYAFLAGILYAFLPYAFLRNVTHLNLVYYPVPLLCTLSVFIACPEAVPLKSRKQFLWIGFLACLFQGFNYVYYSFFAALLFVFAFLISEKKAEVAPTAGLCLALLSLAAGLNQIPTFLSWDSHGIPPDLGYKYAFEAEIYGAKLRKMIAPYPGNPIPFLDDWGQRDLFGHFPFDDSESRAARMGLVTSVGLLGSLGLALGLVRTSSKTLRFLSRLTLFVFLMITVGGFGAVFNLLIVPDIRCYNRFSIFLAFFSLAAIFVWISHGQWTGLRSLGVRLLAVFLTALSLYDQTREKEELISKRAQTLEVYRSHEKMVNDLESQVVGRAKVFMLPITDFPLDRGLHKLGLYAQSIPHQFSTKLDWSWPSFSYQHKIWLENYERLEGQDRLDYLVLSGFDFVWINRLGYQDDGKALIQSFLKEGGRLMPRGSVSPFEVIDLRELRHHLERQFEPEELQRRSEEILQSPSVSLERGFYSAEHDPDGRSYRWVSKEGKLRLFNHSNRGGTFKLSMLIDKQEGPGQILLRNGNEVERFDLGSEASPISVFAFVPPKGSINLEIETSFPRVYAPSDTRSMFFAVRDLKISRDR